MADTKATAHGKETLEKAPITVAELSEKPVSYTHLTLPTIYSV